MATQMLGKGTVRVEAVEPVQSRLFEPLDFFMLRTPLLSLEHYFKLNNSKNSLDSLREYVQHELVCEAIAVASPSLLAALPNISGDPAARKTKQVASSILRYLLRMTTRPTPFGLFAGAAVGSLGTYTQIELADLEQHRKRTRPDMQWLLAIVNKLEKRIDIMKQVRIQRNHIILPMGGRLGLPFSTECGQRNKAAGVQTESITLRSTEAVQAALDIASEPTAFARVVEELLLRYPEAGEEKVTGLVWQLFGQEFFISELRPPLTGDQPLQYVIERLDNIVGAEEERAVLLEVQALIEKYDAVPIGQGLELYTKLTSRMKEFMETDAPVQVDLRLETKQAVINQQVGQEIARVAECLWKLSLPQRGVTQLQGYRLDFIERYGTAQEVPILEVLSDELGLGAPANYTYPRGTRTEAARPRPSEQREIIFMERMIRALANRQLEVELTDDVIEQLSDPAFDASSAPDSLEIYAEVVARSQEAVDQGDYLLVIGPNPGSQGAGSSFGRFLDILGPEVQQSLRDVYKRQAELRPDVLFVEAAYLPPNGRVGNVALTPNLRDYELVMGTNAGGDAQSLSIDDIVVGATLDRLYIKSKKLGKEVVVTAGNMMNFNSAPNVYRFLREVSLENVRNWQPFMWGSLDVAPFVPRVRYGRTILSSASWKLNMQMLGIEKDADEVSWYLAFAKWRDEWMVPRFVYMAYADHRVLLDLENSDHLTELRAEMSRSKRVTLREMVGSFEERFSQGENGNYTMECVFPVIKKKTDDLPNSISGSNRAPVDSQVRLRMPGSEWLFLKLYGVRSREDEFISSEILEFAAKAMGSGVVKDWFFMRYRDPEPHIRLRFYGDPQKLMSELMPAVHQWSSKLLAEGFIQRMMIDTYDREVERYGGPELIAEAEKVFAADSRTSARLLTLLRYKQTDLPNFVVAAISIIDIMTQYGLSFERQFSWLDRIVKKEEHIEEFRGWRKKLLPLADPHADWAGLRAYPSGEALLTAFRIRVGALQAYSQKVAEAAQNQSLWNRQELILGSVIHMHCNRLMGVDRDLENKAMVFARHILFNQRHWRGIVSHDSK